MKIDRLKLIKILNAMQPGLASKENVEQSTSFIFAGNQIITYNDEIAISHPIDFELEGAVIAKKLLKLLESLKDAELEITTTNTEMAVAGAKDKAGIKFTLKTNINEIVEVLGKAKKWHDLPEAFCNAIKFCIFSVGKDCTKPMLTCVHISDKDIFACDDYRVTKYTFDDADLLKMNIPANEVRNLKDYAPTSYSTTPGWVHFKNKENVIYSCRTFEGAYPKEQILKIIDSINGEKVILPENLSETLNCASIFTKDGNKVVSDNQVHVTLESGKITVRGVGSEGWFEAPSRIRYKGPTIEFETNPDFMQDILKFSNEVIISNDILRFEGPSFVHVMRTTKGHTPEKKTTREKEPEPASSFEDEPPFDDEDIPF